MKERDLKLEREREGGTKRERVLCFLMVLKDEALWYVHVFELGPLLRVISAAL